MKLLMYGTIVSVLLVLAALPAGATISITGSLGDAQVVAGAYVERGGAVTPSVALCAPVESGDHETSAMLVEVGKAYAHDFAKPFSKPLHTLAGGLAVGAGRLLRHAEVDFVAKGRDSIPTSWAEWQVVGRVGLGTTILSGNVHAAICWRLDDLRLGHPDGAFAAGSVWRW